jgi:hypothetical protein
MGCDSRGEALLPSEKEEVGAVGSSPPTVTELQRFSTPPASDEIAMKEDILGKLIKVNFTDQSPITDQTHRDDPANVTDSCEENVGTELELDERDAEERLDERAEELRRWGTALEENSSDQGSLDVYDGSMYGPPSRDDSSITSHAPSVEEEHVVSKRARCRDLARIQKDSLRARRKHPMWKEVRKNETTEERKKVKRTRRTVNEGCASERKK